MVELSSFFLSLIISGLVQSFFSPIFDVATLPGDHPQEDLVTVGYRPPAMKF
jgi:hypothetical protein